MDFAYILNAIFDKGAAIFHLCCILIYFVKITDDINNKKRSDIDSVRG